MSDDQREREPKGSAPGALHQSFEGPAISQTGNQNTQNISIDYALVQTAPRPFDQALALLRTAIQDFTHSLMEWNTERVQPQGDVIKTYRQDVVQHMRPLIRALAQGVVRIPDELLSRELEVLVEEVLEAQGGQEIRSGGVRERLIGLDLFPLYLVTMGVLGAGTATHRTDGMTGLLSPTIRWEGQELPWVVLLPLAEERNVLFRRGDHGALTKWVSSELFEKDGWLSDVMPAATGASSGWKACLTTEALLAMLVYGAQEQKCYDPRAGRLERLMGAYVWEAEIAKPALARRVRELSSQGFSLSWLPGGLTDLHTRFLTMTADRSQDW